MRKDNFVVGPMFYILVIIFFVSHAAMADDGWGSLKGSLVVSGATPKIELENIDKDQATCQADGEAPADDNLIIGKKGELKDAFVMLYRKSRDPKPAIHDSYESLKKVPAVLDNKNCRFEPHAMILLTGQTFRLKNSDDVGHNCHIVMLNNEENINIPKGDFVDIQLTAPEKVPGNVVCDIHKWMDAVVMVRDDPYATVTNGKGQFEIENIPAGTWKFQFWHKKVGYMRKLEVADYDVGRRGEIEVTIKAGEALDLGALSIDSANFKK